MYFALLLLAMGSLLAVAGAPEAPPLTEAQHTQIRDLVRTAQQQLALLDDRVAAKRAELTELYRGYQLDERRCEKLLQELNDLQRQTLEVHQRVQIRLRRIVSEAQFHRLRQRLERVLAAPTRPELPPASAPGAQKGTRP